MGELEPPKLLLLFDNKKGPYCKRGVNKFRCGVNEIDPISNCNRLIDLPMAADTDSAVQTDRHGVICTKSKSPNPQKQKSIRY